MNARSSCCGEKVWRHFIDEWTFYNVCRQCEKPQGKLLRIKKEPARRYTCECGCKKKFWSDRRRYGGIYMEGHYKKIREQKFEPYALV